jgi:hypothetical protein
VLSQQVQTTHEKMIRRKYKVKMLSNEGASKLMFYSADADREMSVAEYFANRYQRQYVPHLLLCLMNSSFGRRCY